MYVWLSPKSGKEKEQGLENCAEIIAKNLLTLMIDNDKSMMMWEPKHGNWKAQLGM